MAKMLRNTPGGRWWVCRCRQCRTSPSKGHEDAIYRRNQRSREDAEVRELSAEIASNCRWCPGEPAEDY